MTVYIDTYDYIVIGLYLVGIMISGIWFGRYTKSTKDFFLGGQRFSWWLVAISCVATLVGSYSFINYSELGYKAGVSSITYYTNDWFILPIFVLAWLPIIYFSKVLSIPEYFGRRFDSKTRLAALFIIMIYLIGYIAINLYTVGTAFSGLFGYDPQSEDGRNVVYLAAIIVAIISTIYMHHGGQTSVIMTDLLQGFILIAAGFAVFIFGLFHIGGWDSLWSALPESHKLPFPGNNTPPEFHAVGAFWSDAITGSIAFYCMNQGVLMRFMSVKSVNEGKKAICVVIILMMPIAAIAVSNAGWLGAAMVSSGEISGDVAASNMFVQVSNKVCRSAPGVFGLVIAALVAALMSTLDTLINAVSAIGVNDIWKPFVSPGRDDKYYLRIARYFALGVTGVGILLVPVFGQFKYISEAFTHFTSLMTPPMIVVIVLAILWKRFTATAAFCTLIIGFLINVLSVKYPYLVSLVDHGVGDSYRSNLETITDDTYYPAYSHMRAYFGTIVAVTIAVVVTFLTKNSEEEQTKGLTICSLDEAKKAYKGGEVNEKGEGIKITLNLHSVESSEKEGEEQAVVAHLSEEDMKTLYAQEGDLLFVSDPRIWLGGLRSIQVKAGTPHQEKSTIKLSASLIDQGSLIKKTVTVEKLM